MIAYMYTKSFNGIKIAQIIILLFFYVKYLSTKTSPVNVLYFKDLQLRFYVGGLPSNTCKIKQCGRLYIGSFCTDL